MGCWSCDWRYGGGGCGGGWRCSCFGGPDVWSSKKNCAALCLVEKEGGEDKVKKIFKVQTT